VVAGLVDRLICRLLPPPEDRLKRSAPTDTTVEISLWKFSVGGVVWGIVVERLSEALMGSTLAFLRTARSNRIDNQVLAIGRDLKARELN
jgi:hypothetical protein